MNNDPAARLHASIPIYSDDRDLHSRKKGGQFTSAQASAALLPPLDAAADRALQAILAQRQSQPGALLPILHDLQDTVGHIPPAAVPVIARALNLSRAEVHGVVTYYHHFRSVKPAAPVLQICRAEACQSMGGDALWVHAQTLPNCQVEAVYCLGLCAQSPAALWCDEPVARLTPQRLDALVGA